MRELVAVKDRLATMPQPYPVHLVRASEVSGQYLILGGRGYDLPDEMPLGVDGDDFDSDFRVTAVTGTPEGAGIMLDRVRALLSPRRAATRIPMASRSVWVKYLRSEVIDVDTSTTIAGTNRHPAYGVDTYAITSEPL